MFWSGCSSESQRLVVAEQGLTTMPEMRYYTVTQTREVKIVANSVLDAANLGDAAFKNGLRNGGNEDFAISIIAPPEGIWGNATEDIKVIDLNVKRDR